MTARALAAALAAAVAILGVHVVLLAAGAVIAVMIIFLLTVIAGRVAETGLRCMPEPGPGEAEPEAPGGVADGTAEAVPGPGIRDAGSSAISGPIWSAPEPVLNGSAAHA